MRRSGLCSLALLCLAASLALAQGSRMGGWGSPLFGDGDGLDMIKSKLRAATGSNPRVRDEAPVGRKGGEVDRFLDNTAFVAIKYRVPPSQHDKFVDEWENMYKTLDKKEKYNRFFKLNKMVQDNIHFFTYGEWDTMSDFIEHWHSGHVMDFHEFLANEDITWELFQLKNVTTIEKENRSIRDPASVERGKGKKDAAHIIFTYHAEPSVKEDFIDAWEDMAERVWKEDGNMVFSLRKIGTNNHHFIGYGSWDSWSDFMDHLDSGHCKDFRKFMMDNDIQIYWEPVMRMYGDHDME